jgi:Protein of unknown function (DUF3443)
MFNSRALCLTLAGIASLGIVSCGGDDTLGGSGTGGTTPTANNVVSVAVTAGPDSDAINVLYTTVTVCVPGTSTCQTIDNIQVDTGSYGLRLLAPVLTLSLPVSKLSDGNAIAECTSFVDGYSWGPVALVDVQISGETASSVPVQLIGDSRYPSIPTDCSGSAPTSENTVATFGANGILGIGPFAGDCGDYCASNIPSPTPIYYACSTSTSCAGALVPVANQVPNPITLFATDNNGSIISLPSVAAAGAATVTGSLIFGIDTESNNASGSHSVVPIATSGTYAGYFTTTYNSTSFPESFIDSGSNAYFFVSSLTACSGSGFAGFYCPSSTTSLTGEIALSGSSTVNVDFSIGDAMQINAEYNAYPGLGGTNTVSDSFDWGLPFFYGRQVYNAIDGATTSVGTGPYIAF